MSYYVVVPGALVPASVAPAVLARAKLPDLVRRLRRAAPSALQKTPAAVEGAVHLWWLWSQFGGTTPVPVTAPYAWRSLNGAGALDVASELPLWHADPVHFALARDHLLLTRIDGAALPADQLTALAEEAAAAAAEFGATLRVLEARHWFVCFDPPWQIEAITLDAALGRSARDVLPRGDAAAKWRKLHTEIQIRWHQHPVNQRREAEGQRTINGLWLHGGGQWAPLPKRPFAALATRDPTLCGWGLASGLAPNALLKGDTMPAQASPTLAYWPGLQEAARFESWEDWIAALERMQVDLEGLVGRAFAAGFASVTLVLAGERSVRTIELRGSDRFRFWRNTSLAEWLAEPDAT